MVSILIHCSNKSEKVSILHCTDVVEFRRVFGVRHDQPELPHFQEATGERAVYCALLYRLEIGPVLMRVVLVGLADSLPMEAVARVADIVAPLLHTPAFTSNSSKQQWAYAALR